MAASTPDREQISAVIDQYRRGFATMNVDDLVGLWDRDYDALAYVALEEAVPRRTWQDIEDYYRSVPSTDPSFRVVAMRVETLSMGVVGDVAHVLCRFHFAGEHGDTGQAIVAGGRATFLLRRRGSTWQVIHYHESAPPGDTE